MANKVTLKGVVTKVERTSRPFDAFGVPFYNRYEVQLEVEGRVLSFEVDKVAVPKGDIETAPITMTVAFPDDWEVE